MSTRLVYRGDLLSFLTVLTRLLFSQKITIALLAVSIAGIALTWHRCVLPELIAQLAVGPFLYIYVHEVAQYLALGVDVYVGYEGGFVVLRPATKPRRPRMAIAIGLLAPTIAALVAWTLAPITALVILLFTAVNALVYVVD